MINTDYKFKSQVHNVTLAPGMIDPLFNRHNIPDTHMMQYLVHPSYLLGSRVNNLKSQRFPSCD